MKSRSRIANISLFLLAVSVLFAANLSWCSSAFTFAQGSILGGCDIANLYTASPEGIVILPNGEVIVSAYNDQLYYFFLPTSLTPCSTYPPTATPLNPTSKLHVRGMALGLDNNVYAVDPGSNLIQINPANGNIQKTVLAGVTGALGMALDPISGDLFVTRNIYTGSNQGPYVYRISHLYSGTVSMSLFATIDITQAGLVDGLAFPCDGAYLMVAAPQTGDDKVFKINRSGVTTNTISYPRGEGPDGIVFGAPGSALQNYAFTNDRNGNIYSIDLTTLKLAAVATGGGDGDFVSVDTRGDMLATQAGGVITAVYWKQGVGAGGFVLPGGALCSSLHCAAQAAAASGCLTGDQAATVAPLAVAACSTASCGGCAAVNLNLTSLITVLEGLDPPQTCLDPLLTAAKTMYGLCPCYPDFNKCPQAIVCDLENGCPSHITSLTNPDFKLQDAEFMRDWRAP